MEHTGRPLGSPVLAIVKCLEPDARAAVLIRHSVRGSIEEEGPDAPLTEDGRKLARRFGSLLPEDLSVLVHTSPRRRCVQTAEEIVEGFRQAHPGGEASLLGSEESVASILHSSAQRAAAQALLQEIQKGARPDSGDAWNFPAELVVSADLLAKHTLRAIARIHGSSKAGTVHVFVDHDLHLIVLRERVLGTRFARKAWLNYLDGFVLILLGDGSLVANMADQQPHRVPLE